MRITVSKIAEVTGGNLCAPAGILAYEVDRPLTDSRSLTDSEHTAFFAITTGTGDGHRYIPYLYSRGVRVFVVRDGADVDTRDGCAVISVPDPLLALQQIATYMRGTLCAPVIAITGSCGKTTIKEYLYSALHHRLKISRSPRSWNSQVGVPLAIWSFDDDADLYIVEAGISSPGEMDVLEQIIRPDYGVFTALTAEHVSNFSDVEQLCREKALLFRDCKGIIYDSVNPKIGTVLHNLYPGKDLIPIRRNKDIVDTISNFVKCGNLCDDVTELTSSRIDIFDLSNGVTLAYDYFTCDLSGIATGLDALRRRVPTSHDIVVVLGDLAVSPTDESKAYQSLEKLLAAYGVVRIIAVGPRIVEYVGKFTSSLRCDCYPDGITGIMNTSSPEDFFEETVYINDRNKPASTEYFSWMCDRRNITRLEVNLDSLAHNFRVYRSILPAKTGIIGMIKADGYGCGAVEVARTLQTVGADMVAVAVVDEGVQLRRNGVTIPVIVLDPWCENLRAIFAYNLEPTIIEPSERTLSLIAAAARREGLDRATVHLKLDTGMHRVGLSENEIPAFLDLLSQYPEIRIGSIFSHLATADCIDLDEYTEGQMALFDRMSTRISESLDYPVRRHILNTAGMIRYGKRNVYDMARLGIGLYGVLPLPEPFVLPLKPVARLVTRIISMRDYPAGACIGYGCRGRLLRQSRIATLPVGYADGIDRHLGNGRASFLVDGQLCPTVGNICMDLCMIDITDLGEVKSLEVEIFGENAPIERLSDILDTIPYEILSRISPRVRRVYYKE